MRKKGDVIETGQSKEKVVEVTKKEQENGSTITFIKTKPVA